MAALLQDMVSRNEVGPDVSTYCSDARDPGPALVRLDIWVLAWITTSPVVSKWWESSAAGDTRMLDRGPPLEVM
jgi:hypothetical protein